MMTPNLEQTLQRLALTFTARDIMVPMEDLTCARDQAFALRLLEENPDFDVIPVERKGELYAYLERGSESLKCIRLRDIVSDGTAILDLVDVLGKQKFCFVLATNIIAGYLHFSDLNKPIVKLPFFVILEALERWLVEKLSPLVNESNLQTLLDPQRVEAIREKMRYMSEKRANLGWVIKLYFPEILKFAVNLGVVKLKQQQIDLLSNVRNRICHADKMLVEEHKDVRRLADTKRICLSVLKDLTDMMT